MWIMQKRLVDHERGLLGLQCWLYQAAKVPSTTTWWDFNYVVYGLILAPPGVAIRPQLCGPTARTGAFFTAARNCGPRYDKLFTDFVGPLLTYVRCGYYLRLVMLMSRKFVDPGQNRPHLSSGE